MFQKLFWSFSDWINCSINLKTFALNFSKFFPINWTIFFSQQIRIFSQILINITSVNSGHKFKNIDTFRSFFWPFFWPFLLKIEYFNFYFFLILDIASVNSGHKSEVIGATRRKSRPREDSICTKNSSQLFDSEGKELCRTLSVLT
jgi:hypothetical protein